MPRSLLAVHRLCACLAALLLGNGCVTVVTAEAESLGGVPPYEEAAPADAPAEPRRPFVGLELEESLAGSLEEMEFLGGLRVATVAPGSPAEAAGLRAGDRVVRARSAEGELDLARVDQWAALLAALAPGEELRLTVERDGGLVDATMRVAERGGSARLLARRFVERRKARCVVETEVADVDGRRRAVARVVELAPSSPLREAELEPGDRLLALDGEELLGAADFARRVAALPYGTDVELEVERGGRRRSLDVELWEPDRELTALKLWPLFAWKEAPDDSYAAFELVDLWLIWLLKYERDGATSRTSILRFIAWESGAGALTEEPAVGARS